MFKLRVKQKENIIMIITSIIIIFILLVYTGCSNKPIEKNSITTDKTSHSPIENLPDKDFDTKVSSLKSEIGKFNGSTKSFLPKDINQINISCNEILKNILKNKQSISSTPEDFLGDSNDFYLKFGDILNIGSNYFRFVEFGSSIKWDGSMMCLYIQIWDEDNVVTLQTLDTIIQTASSVGEFNYYDFIEIDGLYYTNILSSVEGVDSNYFYLSSYKIDEKKLTKFHSNTGLDKIIDWNIKKNEEIGHYLIGYKNSRRYSCSFNDNNIIVNSLDNNEKIISSLKIVLSDQGYSFEETIISSK